MSDQRGELPPSDELAHMPPEQVALYIAPGMNSVTFGELLRSAKLADINDRFEMLQNQLNSLQAQIDEMRGRGPSSPSAPAPAPASRPRR